MPQKAAAAEDSDDSSDSDSSDSETEVVAPVVKAAKNAGKKVVDAGKGAVNGAAKAVEKATAAVSHFHSDTIFADTNQNCRRHQTAPTPTHLMPMRR